MGDGVRINNEHNQLTNDNEHNLLTINVNNTISVCSFIISVHSIKLVLIPTRLRQNKICHVFDYTTYSNCH